MPAKYSEPRLCGIEDCNKEHFGRGWCSTHYARWYRTGSPRLKTKTDEQRFWEKVDKSGECWLWTGTRRNERYGGFKAEGKTWQVHRYSYKLANGSIPDGMHIDHKCFKHMCVNPDHLHAVTPQQNAENRSGASGTNKSSGIRGVHWYEPLGKWAAKVGSRGKKYHGGYFDDIGQAEMTAIALRTKLHTNNLVDRAVERGDKQEKR